MTLSTLPVAGVWSREWEEDPLGDAAAGADRDDDTLVLWTQSCSSGIYVDLRLPKDSPGRSLEAAKAAGILQPRPSALRANGFGKQALESFLKSKEGLLDVILRQKSFAGVLDCKPGDTTESGDALKKDKPLASLASNPAAVIPLCTCFWRRDLDYQPPSGGLDIGVCASEAEKREDGSLLLRETGDDASYAEGWLRLAGTEHGPFCALELLVAEEDDDDPPQEEEEGRRQRRRGYCVRAGNRFAYAVGRPTILLSCCADKSDQVQGCVGKSLADALTQQLQVSNQQEMLQIAASYVAVAGEIDNDGVWSIRHATNPELVGCQLFGNDGGALCCSTLKGTASVGSVLVQTLVGDEESTRKWKVVELGSDCQLPVVQSS